MKYALLLPLLSALLYQQGCDVAGLAGAKPEQVQQKVLERVRPYFPNAQAQVLPQQNAIVVLSCAQNIGEPVVKQVADYLGTSQEVGRLRKLRKWGGVIGAPSYKYLRLGFERWVVELDVDTGGIRTLHQDDHYVANYRTTCSGGTAAGEPSATSSR